MFQCRALPVLKAFILGLSMVAAPLANTQESTDSNTATTAGAIVGTGAFTSFVENMDRSLAFYHDVFGMEIPPLPESGARRYNPANPQLYAMFDIHGASERHESASVPGTSVRVEIMEIQDVDFQTLSLRIQDPGTVTPIFMVRDVEEILTRANAVQAEIVTPGGQPIQFANGTRSVLIRDIDGRFIEIRQPASFPDDAASTGITDIRLSIAVDDLSYTTQVYRDLLGFTVAAETIETTTDSQLQALTGLKTARVQRSHLKGPESSLQIEFVEYDGVNRHPLQMRIQDRGAARLQLRAENIDAMVTRMKNAGLNVISEGEVAVPIPPNFKGALVADPNDFFLTLFATCNNCGASFSPGANE